MLDQLIYSILHGHEHPLWIKVFSDTSKNLMYINPYMIEYSIIIGNQGLRDHTELIACIANRPK